MEENISQQITGPVINKRQNIKNKKWWQKEKKVRVESEETPHIETLHLIANTVDRCIEEGSNCLVFTSYLEKQGKTHIIHELGKTLAKADYKTLIVDCNLVTPALSHIILNQQTEGARGFLDFIEIEKEKVDQITYSDVIPYIKASEMEHLYFMPIKQNVLEGYAKYIRKEEVENLFHILKDKFEIILVEAPSFQNIGYTQSIIEASDGYFMVIKAGAIEKKEANHIKKVMRQIATQSIGVILNKKQSG